MKLDKIVNTMKNTCFNKSKYFHLYNIIFLYQIFINVFNIVNISNIINTKIIDMTIKSSFFVLSMDQTFEIFPKHHGLAAISESFVLNLIIFVPLTNK